MNAKKPGVGGCDGDQPPRYSDRDLPTYAHVPGQTPHPVSHPSGHMHGVEEAPPPPLAPSDWQLSDEYLYGIDLFNQGYYWEAHEAWESLWHASGRIGPIAVWLKCLIHLAAVGVKTREGNPNGVRRHLDKACGRLQRLRGMLTSTVSEALSLAYCGIRLADLDDGIAKLRSKAESQGVVEQPPQVVGVWLRLTTPKSRHSDD